MQLVDPPHDRQIRRRHRPGPVIDTAPAELQQLGLPDQRKFMPTIDHRFALSMPALLSAPTKKIILQRQLPDLGVQHLQIHRRRRFRACRARAKHPRRTVEKLPLPTRDLVRMNVKLLRQLRQRLLALDRGQCHSRLEGRCVVPACPSRHALS